MIVHRFERWSTRRDFSTWCQSEEARILLLNVPALESGSPYWTIFATGASEPAEESALWNLGWIELRDVRGEAPLVAVGILDVCEGQPGAEASSLDHLYSSRSDLLQG